MPAPVLSQNTIKEIAAFLFEGFNDDDASFYFNLPLNLVQAIRLGSVFPAVRRAVIARKRYYVNKIVNGKRLHSGIIWFLERRFPREFAKPETQLGFAAGPTTHNTLVVSAELAEAFLARSKPIDDELSKLLKERDQRSQSLTDSKALSTTSTTLDTPDAGVSSPRADEQTCKELVKDGDARALGSASLDGLPAEARERSEQALDGHLPGVEGVGHPPPVPPRGAANPPLPSSGKNPEISDLSNDKLNISEIIVKRKRGRPMKKKV